MAVKQINDSLHTLSNENPPLLFLQLQSRAETAIHALDMRCSSVLHDLACLPVSYHAQTALVRVVQVCELDQ